MNNFSEFHIIINSNKWFSAVSAYSWQLAIFLKKKATLEVWAHNESPLHNLCFEKEIKQIYFPILNKRIIGIIDCWKTLHARIQNLNCPPTVIWTFEGREHTLCAIHRLLNKKLWKNTKLIRIRGQAATVRNNFFSRWVYNKGVDGVVLASHIIEKRIHFPLNRFIVFPYCSEIPKTEDLQTPFPNWFPEDHIIFFHLGRFDPVKNHKNTIKAFSQMNSKESKISLICVGRSENIKIQELKEFSEQFFSLRKIQNDTIVILESFDKKKSLILIDEKIKNIFPLIYKSHFGIIPSLDSEVICRVAVEFLQVGRPLIVSNAGSLPEVVSKTPSFIFDRSSTEELKNKLELALDLTLDNQKFSTVCKICRAYGQDYFSSARYDLLRNWVLNEGRSHGAKIPKA